MQRTIPTTPLPPLVNARKRVGWATEEDAKANGAPTEIHAELHKGKRADGPLLGTVETLDGEAIFKIAPGTTIIRAADVHQIDAEINWRHGCRNTLQGARRFLAEAEARLQTLHDRQRGITKEAA